MNMLDPALIRDVLAKDKRVVFAYLFGSFTDANTYRDLDIAVYSLPGCNPFCISRRFNKAVNLAVWSSRLAEKLFSVEICREKHAILKDSGLKEEVKA